MQGKVLLTAEHHNWGLSTIYDWQQTKYILFENGLLQSVEFKNRTIHADEKLLNDNELGFIRDNAKEFVLAAEEVDACDGDAWKFEGEDFSFDLGYIYGTDLERIADILTE